MDLMLLRIFQRQVVDQCRYFLIAAETLNSGLQIVMEGDWQDKALQQRGQDRVWFGIQSALSSAANISKLLWGTSDGHRVEDREPLRRSLGVADTSPLRATTMRNHWEHLDERLDKWDRESEHHNHVDHFIAPPGAITGVAEIDMFRSLDPETTVLSFWGDTFELQAIADEILRILPQATAEAEKPHW